MLTDPQSLTITGTAYSLPRVTTGASSAQYQNSDESVQLLFSHQSTLDRVRSMARVTKRKIVTNPLDSTSDYDTLGVYIVIDRPNYGFSMTEVEDLVAAFKTWLTTTSGGMTDKLYGKES